MVRFWLVIVVGLFVSFQFFQWLRGVIMPLPIYVIAGAFLAIASNYEKGLSGLASYLSLPTPMPSASNPTVQNVVPPSSVETQTPVAIPERPQPQFVDSVADSGTNLQEQSPSSGDSKT